MKCLNPISIDIADYETSGINGKVFLPCGKCEVCRNNDSLQWRVRLKEEWLNSENCIFITLTYNDANVHFEQCFNDNGFVGFFPTPYKKDVQNFFKRLRKKYEYYYKAKEIKLSYFLVSEYCPTSMRPHYHALLFNFPILSDIPEINDVKVTEEIQKIWNLGFVKCDKVNEARIGYCTKYMSCETIIPNYLPPPFRLMSKGLGKCYLNKINRIKWHKDGLNNFYPEGNLKLKLPRYLKDKIFSEDEKLMIQQLNYIRSFDDIDKEKQIYHDKNLLKNKKTAVDKIKRTYKNKAIKNKTLI